MFFLNSSIEFVIIDHDNIVNSIECIKSIVSSTAVYITLISSKLDETDELTFRDEISPRISVFRLEDDSEDSLSQFFRSRPWLFTDLFLTSDFDRISLANSFAVGTVFLRSNPSYHEARVGADLTIAQNKLSAVLENGFKVANTGEYYLEAAKELLAGEPQGGWKTKLIRFASNHPEFEHVYSLGRFLASDDPFLQIHLYSRFIKIFKVAPDRFKNVTSALLEDAFRKIATRENVNDRYLITYVPKKPQDVFDRNKIALSHLQQDRGLVHYDGLTCIRQYRTQKEVKGAAAKRENVRGAFTSNFQINNETVFLFDDIYTSGATQAECAAMLLNHGAKKVIPVNLGLFCPANAPPLLPLNCEKCGSQLSIQFGTKSGIPFWGCRNYLQGGHTHHFYAAGLRRLRKIWRDAEDMEFPL